MNTIPRFLYTYFWGDDLTELSWEKHQRYIIQTLLEKGDAQAVSWLLKQITPTEIKIQLPSLKLSPKSENFWNIYLS